MHLFLLPNCGVESTFVGAVPIESDAIFDVRLQLDFCYFFSTLCVRAQNWLIFAFFLVWVHVLVCYWNGTPKLVVLTAEFGLAEDVFHQNVGLFVDCRRTSNWARVGFLLPLDNTISAVVSLALLAFDRIFNNFKADLTE